MFDMIFKLWMIFFISFSPKAHLYGEENNNEQLRKLLSNDDQDINNSEYNEAKIQQEISEPGFDLTEDEIKTFKIWRYGVIPYFIDDYSFDSTLSAKIREFLNTINLATGLSFMEMSVPSDESNERWVLFVNRRGVLACEDYSTSNFTNSGVQKVVLGYDCLNNGVGLAATVLVLVGVPPQHNAPNRDNYVTVVMENIIPEKAYLFKALKDTEWLFHDLPYDFYSAGHYDSHKYSLNGSATIMPKGEKRIPFGESDKLSISDIRKIRMLYNYMLLKKPKPKASDCSKIFKPGVNFQKFKPSSENTVKPRKKPNKYLGSNNNKLGNAISTEKKGSTASTSKNANDNDAEENVTETDLKRNALKFSKGKILLQMKTTKHLMLTGSDFDTDIENERKKYIY